MPLPTPSKGQSEDDFIGSCMSNDTMQKEFPDKKQRLAVCYRQYREERDAERAKNQFHLTDEDWNLLTKTEQKTFINRLAPVGSKKFYSSFEHTGNVKADRIDIFVPIVRAFETHDGRKMIYGYAALFDSPDVYGTAVARELVEKSLERLEKYPAFRYLHRSPLGRILFNETAKTPTGELVFTFVDDHGFHILAEVNKTCDREWSFIREGGWGLSYGLLPHKIEQRRVNGKLCDVFVEGELYEVSAVDTPAHEDAAIHVVNRRLVADFQSDISGEVTKTKKIEEIEVDKAEVEQMLKDSEERILKALDNKLEVRSKTTDFMDELKAFEERILKIVNEKVENIPQKDDGVKNSINSVQAKVEDINKEISKLNSLKTQLKSIGEDTQSIERKVVELEKAKEALKTTVTRTIEELNKRLTAVENAPDEHSPATNIGKTVTRNIPIGFRSMLDRVE